MRFDALLKNSLKTRVALFSLAIFILSLWMLRSDMERLLGEQQSSTVSLAAAKINQELLDRMAALGQLAGRIDGRLLQDRPALQALLEDRLVLRQLFNGDFFVTDAKAR